MVYHLNRKDIPAYLLGHYEGNKLKAEPCTSVTIQSDAGLWSGGSRERYIAVELISGKMIALPDQDSAPWDSNRTTREIPLKPGFAILRTSVFCGKNMGLTYYIHPDDIVKLVPKNTDSELCAVEKRVLRIIDGYKSFARNDEFRRAGIELGEADAIKARLISLGLLNKAGAITVKGRNACEGVRL